MCLTEKLKIVGVKGIDRDQFRRIPFSKRSNLRDLESQLKVSKSSLHRSQKRGTIRRHSNSIKPFIKEDHSGKLTGVGTGLTQDSGMTPLLVCTVGVVLSL
jgi:hypothetical protein